MDTGTPQSSSHKRQLPNSKLTGFQGCFIWTGNIKSLLAAAALSRTMTASSPGFTADIVSLNERLHLEDYLARRMGK